METCVLLPQEFSLAVLHDVAELHVQLKSSARVAVRSNTAIPQGVRVYPFQGTLRLDQLQVFSYLSPTDVKHRFGCYDEISEVNGRPVRHCNWVRFVRFVNTCTPEVNLIGSKLRGEPTFEVIRPILSHTEIVVYHLPDAVDTDFALPAIVYLRHSLYRRTMQAILQESPLDLSVSLVSPARSSISNSSSSGVDTADDESVPPHSLSPVMSHAPPALSVASTPPSPSTTVAAAPASLSTRRQRERTMLPCEICGKAFDRPSLLKRHMRTHTGEKPHVCDVCGKGFSTSSSLNTHRRIHSGEKPHQCGVCGKRFTASSNLYYHKMTHIKEKPHKCQLCSKSFPTPGDLKSHMYVHSGSWPFKCHVCSRGFSKQTNLKNHLFLHTGDKPHKCKLCNKKFALACNLRAHLKTHEGVTFDVDECVQCGAALHASSADAANTASAAAGAGAVADCSAEARLCANCAAVSMESEDGQLEAASSPTLSLQAEFSTDTAVDM